MVQNDADAMGRQRQPEEMVPLLKRHEVQVLRRAGHSRAQVARLSGVSVKTIQRIDRETAVVDVDQGSEAKRRAIGRPSVAEPFREYVTNLLAKEPELLTLEVLRRAKQKGYRGSKTALYALAAAVRPKSARPMVRFEGLAGEFAQHDFGHVDVRFVDGTTKRIHFFASRLKYSRWVQVSIVDDEGVESLVRTLVEHYAAMGGVPLMAVFDRPKTVALKWKKDGAVTEWNSTFAQVMLELGVGVELCWPYSGNQKGSVEKLVGWVKTSFFKQRRFLDEEDLQQQLSAWLVEANTVTASRATGVTPAARMVEERARLRPLKVMPDELALRIPIFVGPTAMVTYQRHPYSMPPDAIGMPGTLFLYRDRVRIVAGRYEAVHERDDGSAEKSVLPEHRAEMLSAVSGKRAKRYYKREQLLALGPAVVEYLTEVVHRRPRRWVADVDEMYAMLERFGESQLRHSIELALGERLFGAEYVGHFIERLAIEVTSLRGQVQS